MTPFTVTFDREQLFRNACLLTLYATENLQDVEGVSQVERYRLGDGERDLYNEIDEGALYDLYDRCQILFKGMEGPLTVSAESFVLAGNLPSGLPESMVAHAMNEALTSLILARWFDTRGAAELQMKYDGQAEKSLTTVKSRILSRNTQRVNYRAY